MDLQSFDVFNVCGVYKVSKILTNLISMLTPKITVAVPNSPSYDCVLVGQEGMINGKTY